MALDEAEIIATYLKPLAGEGAFGFRDDAALLGIGPGEDLVVTKDMVAVGVHFLPDDPPDLVARKALRVNLSDIAAKGAESVAFLLGAAFPKDMQADWLAAFCRGLAADQQEFGLAFLGGDTIAIDGGPVLSITAIGRLPKGGMVHRFTAQPGDHLYVSGTIGEASAGLAILQGRPGVWDDATAEEREALVHRYRLPQPRTRIAAAIRGHAHAAMDISDGLVGDADKMAVTSGVTARIDAERVPLPLPLAGASEDERGRLMTGGDDYEILAAVAPAEAEAFRAAADRAGIPVTRIGTVLEGEGEVDVRFHDRPMRFKSRSYVHGRGESGR